MQAASRDDLAGADETPRSAPRRPSRGRAARWRRRGARALLAVPLGVVLAVDLARRGERVVAFEGQYLATYAGAIAESLLVWGVLLHAAARRRGAARHVAAFLFVLAFTLSIGGQRYFHDQYNAYLNVDVSLFATNFMDSVANQLFADLGTYLGAKALPFVTAVALVLLARRLARPRATPARITGVLAPLLLAGALFVPTQHRHVQASTPDVLYLHAAGGLLRTQLGFTDQSNQIRPRSRESLPVTLAKPPGARRPNVLFVILESVRADSVCADPEGECRHTPYSNALVPGRFPLRQMRALDSCTAISLAVLWAGVAPTESREVLHTWPLLFDYARAAGYDTAFWTAQNMMFGNARLWVKNLGVSEFVSATELDPASDLDMGAPEHLLAARVNERIGRLHEPFLAVVQASNLHYPYLVDPAGPMPFQPWTTSKGPDENQRFLNYYWNGVHQQDRHVAAMIRRIRESPLSANTVIVYTSDHGEAFREHHQMGHTFSVLDEEIHVPAWIDAPPGLLGSDEVAALGAARDAFVFHPDLTATVLDLMGVWDDPGIARYRERMIGQSLLRAGREDRAMPLTNCAAVWSCAFENWGYMRGPMKLEARAWDPEWHCYDLEQDPRELANLGVGACGDLLGRAMETWGRLPGGERE